MLVFIEHIYYNLCMANIHARSTKYRKKVLTGEVAEYCRKTFNEIADEFEFQIAETIQQYIENQKSR